MEVIQAVPAPRDDQQEKSYQLLPQIQALQHLGRLRELVHQLARMHKRHELRVKTGANEATQILSQSCR